MIAQDENENFQLIKIDNHIGKLIYLKEICNTYVIRVYILEVCAYIREHILIMFIKLEHHLKGVTYVFKAFFVLNKM